MNFDRFEFRAWHREEKRMFEVYFLGIKRAYVLEETDTRHDRSYPLHALDLMQCTGLKDKNGLLIFEGDIIIDPSYHEYDIEYDKKYIVEWSPWRGWLAELGETLENFQEIEIVGNRFEEPSLPDGVHVY